MKGSKHAKLGNRKGGLGYRTPSRVKAGGLKDPKRYIPAYKGKKV